MHRYVYVIMLTAMIIAGCSQGGKATLTLDKKTYDPLEEIKVTFTAPASFESNAWIGIIPSEVQHGNEAENDRYDLVYQYLEKRTSGTLIFKAPDRAGSYDLRMHDTDNNGREVAYASFTVKILDLNPTLKINKSVFSPGEKITVSFTASANLPEDAWIGIIPSDIPHGSEAENDAHDIVYGYMQKRAAGTMTFDAPDEPGKYDVRMHDTDNNGKELASVSFEVK